MRKFIAYILCAIINIAATAQPVRYSVLSPDKKIKVIITGTPLTYAVEVDGKIIIEPSILGLQFDNHIQVGENSKVVSKITRTINTTWNNPLGKSGVVRDNYNELHLHLQENTSTRTNYQVVFRAFNDGMAFRYLLPTQASLHSFTLIKEQTAFAFPGDYTGYVGDNKTKYSFKRAQELEYKPQLFSTISPDSTLTIPFLVKTPTMWVAIMEADLLDWSGMYIKVAGKKNNEFTLTTTLAPALNGKGLVNGVAPHKSPWRVIMMGRKPGDLYESNIVLNLSTPSKIGDASWVKPGIMAWDHWWKGGVKMTTDMQKKYIQLAADMGWPYQLIDWQWYGKFNNPAADITKVAPNVDMPELLRFAKEKNVKLWVWLHWKDVDRDDAYKKAFALYEQWGLAGIKIDFMDRDDQEMVNWYEKISKAAADHHLMLNFHGAYKPTGLERTYPNQITREGILGNEHNRWDTNITSKHKLILPFTRFLAGPADFTPGGFRNRQPEKFKKDTLGTQVQGTRAGELALFVIYNSPITVACDYPDHYKDQPGADFLKVVPTVWDDTKVIEAEVGEYMTVARRKGSEWFIGGLTDNTARNLIVPLTFLTKGKYKAEIWKDAKDSNVDAEKIDKEERVVTSKDKLLLPMVRNGGYVAKLTKL